MSATKSKIVLFRCSAVHDGDPTDCKSPINNAACFKVKDKLERYINNNLRTFSKDQVDWKIKFGKFRYYGFVFVK